MITNKEWNLEWCNAFEAQGHTFVLETEIPAGASKAWDIDIFVYDHGRCNGPGCSTCHWSTCWHCTKAENIPPCSKPTGI